MNIESILEANEKLELVVEPEKGLMFHTNDLIRIIIALIIAIISFYTGLNIDHFIGYVFLGIGILVALTLIKSIFKRYNNGNGTIYILTNKRIIFSKNGKIHKQKSWSDIHEITSIQKDNNKGYIILGKTEPILTFPGVNLAEDEYILDNLTNYNQVSTLINKLTDK